MRTVRTKVYKFSELSEQAKTKAIEQFRDINVSYDWWDFTYEDFKMLCDTIGIDIDLKQTYFSGFASQGDGAAFTAGVDIQKLIAGINAQSYLSHAPNIEKETRFSPDKCNVDKRILSLIERGIIDVSAHFKAHDRPYCSKLEYEADHEYRHDCNGRFTNYDNIDEQLEKLGQWIKSIGEDLDRMLYRLLENEYDYLTSEEAIIETIEANEYEFTKDGKQF